MNPRQGGKGKAMSKRVWYMVGQALSEWVDIYM